MAELYDTSFGRGDRPAPAKDARDEADRTGRSDGEPGTKMGEEDAAPMTRDDYAHRMRQGPPLEVGETTYNSDDDHSPDDEPSAEERARLHDMYQDYLNEHGAGRHHTGNIVANKPDVSPDETRGLAPTGDELLEMDSDNLSSFQKLRREAYEQADDIFEVSEKDGGTIEGLLDRPPAGSHAEIPAGHLAIEQPPTSGVDGGHLVVASMVLAMLGFESVRAVKNSLHKWKAR
jgi:hypothetical protein